MTHKLIIKDALLASGWASNVAVHWDDRGVITRLEPNSTGAVDGALIPGLANLHSHAHQRAMAGLAEKSGSGTDSFWTWRATMYQFLAAMQPHHLHAVAAQLYLELLQAGYTRVAEFQYLHHQSGGGHYDNPAEMSLQTLQAAQDVGLGITILPVHYQYSGFGAQPVNEAQARFFNTPDDLINILERVRVNAKTIPNANVGVAGHSLRATTVSMFSEVLNGGVDADAPIHMHVAEQTKEVEDCVVWSGVRPVDYCLDNFAVDERWCLIHATHMSASETQRLAKSGAVAGICPSTEANLGDGFFNATEYLNAGGRFGIGSDSHISTSPTEELRWFEYGQRLLHRSRNQLSGGANQSTGKHLLELAAQGGAQACGVNGGSIAVGQRADFVVLDTQHPLLVAREKDELIDSWIFSGNQLAVQDVYVGGQAVIQKGRHAQQDQIAQRFKQTLKELRT